MNVSTRHLLGKHLRTAPGAPLAVALLVLVLAALAVFGPLALASVSDAALQHRLDSVSPLQRDARTSIAQPPQSGARFGEFGSIEQQWGPFDAALEAARTDAGPPLDEVLQPAQSIVRVGPPNDRETFNLSYALDPAFADRIELIEGTLPDTPAADWWERFGQAFFGAQIDPAPGFAIDIVLSAETAETLEWTVGETRLHPVSSSFVTEASPPQPVGFPVRLSGVFDAADPDDGYWLHAQGIMRPSTRYDGENQPYTTATGFVDPMWLAFMSIAHPLETTAWYPLDPAAITSANATEVLADLRGFTSRTHSMSADVQGIGFAGLTFRVDALPVLERAVAEGRSLAAVVAMLVAGPLGVAGAVLVLGARMMLERRRPALELLSARGAQPRQLRTLLAIEGAVVGIVPAALGAALGFFAASLAFGARPSVDPALFVVPVLLAIAPVAVLALGARPAARRERADAPGRRSVWRPIIELAVVGLAVVATALLLARGVGDPATPADPLVLIAPLLLAFVVCIVTLRLYPLFLRMLQRRLRRGPGFAGFLGAARALRDPATGLAPVLALVVGVSIAVSSGILLSTIETGVDRESRAVAGADLQLQTGRFAQGADNVVAGIDGVAAVAAVGEAPSVEVLVEAQRRVAPVYFVDQAALAAVQGSGGLVPEDVDLGGGTPPMPVLFSERAHSIIAPEGTVTVGGVPVEVAGTLPDTAPFTAATSWLLADAGYAEAVFDRTPPMVSLLIRLEEGADAASVAAEAVTLLDDANIRVLTPASVRASIDDGPASMGLRATLVACIALAALLSAIAVVMTLVLGTRARVRILALLQTLGPPARSGSAIVAWELWPACAAAIVAGAAFGAAMPVLLLRVVDLRPFTGGAAQPAYAADPLVLGAAIGGFLVVAAVFTIAALAISRRVRAAAILRTVEDS